MIPQLLIAILLSIQPATAPATPPPFVPQDCVVEVTSVQPLSGTLGFANGSGSEYSFAYAWSILGDALLIEVHITSGTYQIVGVVVDAVTADLPVTFTEMFLPGSENDVDLEFPLVTQDNELVSLTVFLSRCGVEVPEPTTTTTTVPEGPVTTVQAIGAGGPLPSTGPNSTGLSAALMACVLGVVMVAIARRSRPA